jgi:hypothetical protein
MIEFNERYKSQFLKIVSKLTSGTRFLNGS